MDYYDYYDNSDVPDVCYIGGGSEREQELQDLARVGTRYYVHNSPRGNRESILEKGLILHHPATDGNWGQVFPDLQGPRGVYVFPVLDTEHPDEYALTCQYDGIYEVPGHEGEPFDHYLIDAEGLDSRPDPSHDMARVLTEAVPPERLTLLNP
jgi:hypothetical protein